MPSTCSQKPNTQNELKSFDYKEFAPEPSGNFGLSGGSFFLFPTMRCESEKAETGEQHGIGFGLGDGRDGCGRAGHFHP